MGPLSIHATGRGMNAQTRFVVSPASAAVRVPRVCSARAVLSCGDNTSYETEKSALELGAAGQMVWRQVGQHATGLRVQVKLAPATGGYMVTAIRVTAPKRQVAVMPVPDEAKAEAREQAGSRGPLSLGHPPFYVTITEAPVRGGVGNPRGLTRDSR